MLQREREKKLKILKSDYKTEELKTVKALLFSFTLLSAVGGGALQVWSRCAREWVPSTAQIPFRLQSRLPFHLPAF